MYRRKPEAVELVAPPVPEPITYFGPTTMSITPAPHFADGGILMKVSSWVGGQGLAVDGRWGKIFSFQFYLSPPERARDYYRKYKVCKALMEQYRDQIVSLYDDAKADVLMQILPLAANGIMIPHTMTGEEIVSYLP